MKGLFLTFVLILSISIQANAPTFNTFTLKDYIFNKNILSGSISTVIGFIGERSSDSTILKASYGIVQGVGTITIGTGIYEMYRAEERKSMLMLAKNIKKHKNPTRSIYKQVLKNEAQNAQALRYSVMTSSGLLSLQYLSSAALLDSENDLRGIYIFIGSVNLLIFAYSYFFTTKEEDLYLLKFPLRLKTTRINNKIHFTPMLGLNLSF